MPLLLPCSLNLLIQVWFDYYVYGGFGELTLVYLCFNKERLAVITPLTNCMFCSQITLVLFGSKQEVESCVLRLSNTCYCYDTHANVMIQTRAYVKILFSANSEVVFPLIIALPK